MNTITLNGREIPLIYTTWEMKLIQEEIGPLAEALRRVYGADQEHPERAQYGTPEQLEALAKTIRILGNAGLEEAGEKPDLTEKKILRALKPTGQVISEAVTACLNAFNEGMESEIPKEKKDGPVDVVLEDMNKKKEADG